MRAVVIRALSIRQPFAELILRGIKTAEYRSRPTRIIGERFFIYASKGQAARGKGHANDGIWSRELSGEAPPPWMLELAEAMRLFGDGRHLPSGLLVATAQIARCELLVARRDGQHATSDYTDYSWRVARGELGPTMHNKRRSTRNTQQATSNEQHATRSAHPAPVYAWHLRDVESIEPLRPTRHPQPVWFWPL